MSSGPNDDNKIDGVTPFGHLSVGVGKNVGGSSVGLGVAIGDSNKHVYIGATQDRGGKTPFSGKPGTSIGVGFRCRL